MTPSTPGSPHKEWSANLKHANLLELSSKWLKREKLLDVQFSLLGLLEQAKLQ